MRCRVGQQVSIRSRRLSAGEGSGRATCSIDLGVSIRSRRLSAGEDSCRAGGRPGDRFNPLPPTVGGRRTIRYTSPMANKVSIRSRRLSAGEASLPARPALRASFQSAPADCRREKRAPADSRPGGNRFQSAPADCRREKWPAARCRNRCRWFQSAPADCRREKAVTQMVQDPAQLFQSAPADCRREKRWPACPWTRRSGFNPLPPTVGGRRSWDPPGNLGIDVSIRSRRLSAGEGPVSQVTPVSRQPFQSAPADCRREKNVLTSNGNYGVGVSIRSRRLSAGEGPAAGGQRFNPLPPTVGGRRL